MSVFGDLEQRVISFQKRGLKTEPQLYGSISTPKTAPPLGFIETLQALQDLGYLHSGDSLASALHRCGLVLPDQDSNIFSVAPHGLFTKGVVSDEAKTLLECMAQEGFEGAISYHVDGVEQQLHLLGGRLSSSEDISALKFA